MLGTVLPLNAAEHEGLGDKAGPLISLEGWTGDKFFAAETGVVIGGLLPAAVSELTGPSLLVGANTIRTVNAYVAGAPRCVLIEPLLRRATVFLFGAGHLSRELAPLASRVGFRVVVIDDREVFANSEAFPAADEIIVADFGQALGRLSVDESSYLVILTRGHAHDEVVLEHALRTKPGYIGMIGSRTKIATIYRELRAKGFTKEQLGAVHAPIGLPIGARSPEEIAVSILAEVISVRNHGRATSGVRNGAPHDEGRG